MGPIWAREGWVQEKKSGQTRLHREFGSPRRPPEAADGKRLRRLRRAHWGIENRRHWVREGTFREAASQVRPGAIRAWMAPLGNAVIALLPVAGASNLAAACGGLRSQPREALALIGVPFPGG